MCGTCMCTRLGILSLSTTEPPRSIFQLKYTGTEVHQEGTHIIYILHGRTCITTNMYLCTHTYKLIQAWQKQFKCTAHF